MGRPPMLRPDRTFPSRATLLALLLLIPTYSAHASVGLAGWTKLVAHSSGPYVDYNEPVVWDENASRLLYPEAATLWSLVPGQAWTSQHITGTPPDLTTGDRAIFDAARNRILRFG